MIFFLNICLICLLNENAIKVLNSLKLKIKFYLQTSQKAEGRLLIVFFPFYFRMIIRNVTDLFIDLQQDIFHQKIVYRKNMCMQTESFNGDEIFEDVCSLLKTIYLNTCVFFQSRCYLQNIYSTYIVQ